MSNFSIESYRALSDEDKQSLYNGLFAVKARMVFDNQKNITRALLSSHLSINTKTLIKKYLTDHYPEHPSLISWLFSKGIDLGKYSAEDYRNYCIRWLDHLIKIIQKEQQCLRRKNLSNSEFLPTRN